MMPIGVPIISIGNPTIPIGIPIIPIGIPLIPAGIPTIPTIARGGAGPSTGPCPPGVSRRAPGTSSPRRSGRARRPRPGRATEEAGARGWWRGCRRWSAPRLRLYYYSTTTVLLYAFTISFAS